MSVTKPGGWSAAGVTAALAALMSPGNLWAQCALCRDAVAASSDQTREAMNYAIVGLAFMPYVVGAVAAWLVSPALRSRARVWVHHLPLRKTGSPP